jgi:hypothetical protein
VKETHVRNGIATRSTHEGRNPIKYSEQPKDQREDKTDQAKPIAYCGELFFHSYLPGSSFWGIRVGGTLLAVNRRVKQRFFPIESDSSTATSSFVSISRKANFSEP